MAPKQSILEKMEANPRADWQIKDIEKLCNQVGLVLAPPKNGSHYKVVSENLRDILTVPAHRPIKPVYLKMLVSYAKAHILLEENKDG